MSVRRVVAARIVAIASLASVLALAGCSGSAGAGPTAAQSTAGATAAPTTTDRTASSVVVPVVADIPSPSSQITVGCDAFAAQPKRSATVHLNAGDVLAVTLCTNASTGFSWEPPVIDGDALRLTGTSTATAATGTATVGVAVPPLGAAPSPSSGTAVADTNPASVAEQGPSGPVVGAATTTTFLFTAQHGGTATVSLAYSRPWAGGEKSVWSYTLHATVG